jgi:hypothetical protein
VVAVLGGDSELGVFLLRGHGAALFHLGEVGFSVCGSGLAHALTLCPRVMINGGGRAF